MQGYCLAEEERRALRVGLRFSTGVCLVLTAAALVLGSALAFAGLVVIGAVGGFSSRHPFDHVWNRGVRYVAGAPPLPKCPARRRHAFKLATGMLALVAILLAAGAQTAALVVGVLLIGACTTVTVTNLCLPSLALSLVERGRPARVLRAG